MRVSKDWSGRSHARGKASGAVVFNGVDVATNGKRSQVRFPVQDHMGW